MDEPRPKEGTQLVDAVSIVWGRLWLVLLCVAGVLAPIVYHNYTAPPVYEAETSILFEEGTQPIRAFDLSNGFARKSFIINQIEIIKSRTMAEGVAAALPPEVRTSLTADPDTGSGWLAKVTALLPASLGGRSISHQGSFETVEPERALASVVQKSIEAKQVRDSDIVEVTVSANAPEVATVMANTVAGVLKKSSVDVKKEELRAVGQFIGNQLADFQRDLDSSEQALKDYKQYNQVTSLQEQGTEILRRVTEVEVLYNRIKSEREGVEQRLAYLEQKLSESRQTIVPDITRSSSPYIAELQSNLVKQEVERANLLVQAYPEDHPKVQGLDRQIAEIKEKLRSAAAQIADGATLIDPVSQIGKWVQDLVSLRVELVALRAQENTLGRAVEQYESGLQALPEKEFQLAQLIRSRNVNEQIYLMLRQRHEEAQITEAGELGNIRVVDPADQPLSPVSPRKRLNLILGLIAGLTLGVALAFLFESLDSSLKTVEDVEGQTDLSVLGIVPFRRVKRHGRGDANGLAEDLVAYHHPTARDAESYRTLQTNVQFAGENGGPKTVLVTSAGPEEGKSDTVANLGIVMAQAGRRTLLIDADLRRSALHSLFGLNAQPGLTDVLKGEKTFEEAVQATKIEHLDVITRGSRVDTPTVLLRSAKMTELLDMLKGQYDVVLLDSPPAIAVTDPVVLSAVVDGVCLVAESGRTQADELSRTKELLDHAKASTLGVVLNKFDPRHSYRSSHYYYRYYYYHYDQDGRKTRRRKQKSEPLA